MEQLTYCEDCGELICECNQDILFLLADDESEDFKFEYAFESLTEKVSAFKRNNP
jgi:hypothetical protein